MKYEVEICVPEGTIPYDDLEDEVQCLGEIVEAGTMFKYGYRYVFVETDDPDEVVQDITEFIKSYGVEVTKDYEKWSKQPDEIALVRVHKRSR